MDKHLEHMKKYYILKIIKFEFLYILLENKKISSFFFFCEIKHYTKFLSMLILILSFDNTFLDCKIEIFLLLYIGEFLFTKNLDKIFFLYIIQEKCLF